MKSTLLSAAFAAASALGAHDAMAATLNIDFGYDGTDIYITGKGTIDLTGSAARTPYDRTVAGNADSLHAAGGGFFTRDIMAQMP